MFTFVPKTLTGLVLWVISVEYRSESTEIRSAILNESGLHLVDISGPGACG